MKGSRWACSLLVGLCLWAGSDHAAAQGAKEEAKTYFAAAVQAYKTGQFLAAGHAFIEAYKLFKRPEIAFSIGQAFRRQFQIEQKAEHLRTAVWYYREYLRAVKQGGRRLEAVRGLSELTPHIARLGVEEATLRPEVEVATSIMLSSPTPGAVVVLDDGPPAAVPLSREVTPGTHKLEVMAAGYYPEVRKVPVAEGRLVALDVPLHGKPALLTVTGADGADVTVDGRSGGSVPLPRPLELTAGRHFVTVTDPGHKPYAEELSFAHGTSTTVDVALPETDQRVAAHVVLGTGIAAIAAAAVLVVAAELEESDAESIVEKQSVGPITEAERVEHNEAVRARDDFALAGGITAAAGAALGVTALFLYLIDQPSVSPPVDEPAEPAKPAPGEDVEPGLELLATPALTPTVLGASVQGRF